MVAWFSPHAIAQATPPPNDRFTSRQALTGSSVQESVSNAAAGYETGEPDHGSLSGTSWLGKSVWWSWTAPGNGVVTMETTGSDFDTVLAVYLGGQLSGLEPVAGSNDIDDASTLSRVRFPVTSGRIYQIAVDGTVANPGSGGAALRIEFEASPAITNLPLAGEATLVNDQFQNRVLLTGTNVSAIGYNLGAGYVTGEPDHGAHAGSPWLGKTLWWTWRAPGNGQVVIDTTGSTRSDGRELDTLLAAYVGSALNALEPVAANNDIEEFVRTSRISFPVTSNRLYQIVVDGVAANPMSGNIILNVAFDGTVAVGRLNLTTEAAVANDLFVNRVLLGGTDVSAIGYNSGASYETGEPAHAPNWLGKSLWWSWRPEHSGEVTVSTGGSSFDTVLAVYTGATFATLKAVARNDDVDIEDLTSLVRFTPVPGQIYQIAVDGNTRFGTYGTILLNVRQASTASPDHLRIFPAIELEFDGLAGRQYRLQRSSDLVNWMHASDPIFGRGSPVRSLISMEGRPHENFRLIEIP